jgi:hypothetical protein
MTVIRADQDVIVLLDLRRIDPPSARHAEVENQSVAAIGIDQSIFGPPAEARYTSANQALAKTVWHRPPQVRAAEFEPLDPATI